MIQPMKTKARRLAKTIIPSRFQPATRRIYRSARERLTLPLLSIVVPVFNVEPYLEAALDSLLRQQYRRIEIIVVDDGSTDGSPAIIRAFEAKDKRVRAVRQPNAGLGAARNTGARMARGKYLAFLDSDDTVERDGYAIAVACLEESGSDFAATPYRQYVKGRARPLTQWIQAAHRTEMRGVRAADHPEILVNVVAWSKVYRRRFFNRAVGQFPVGVLFEDQVPTARAYVTARKIDVLVHPIVRWRVRETGTSITQNSADEENLRARIDQTESALAIYQAADPALADARRGQLLGTGTYTMTQLLDGDPLYFSSTREAVRRLWPHVSDDFRVNGIPLVDRVLYWLVQNASFDDVLTALENNISKLSSWAFRRVDGVLRAQFVRDPEFLARVGFPDSLLAFGRRDLAPQLGVEATSSNDTQFGVRMSAYAASVPTSESAVSVFAIGSDGKRLDLRSRSCESAEAPLRTTHAELEYTRSGIEIDISVEEAAAFLNPSGSRSDAELMLTIRVDEVSVEVPISTRLLFREDPIPFAASAVSDTLVSLDSSASGILVIRARRSKPVVLRALAVSERSVTLLWDASESAVPEAVVLVGSTNSRRLSSGVSFERFGEYVRCTVAVPKRRARTSALRFKLVDERGAERAFFMTSQTDVHSDDAQFFVERGDYNQPFFFDARSTAFVDSVELDGTNLTLKFSSLPSRKNGRAASDPKVSLYGSRWSTRGTVVRRRTGVHVRFALDQGEMICANGRYWLRIESDGVEIRVQPNARLRDQLPLRRLGRSDVMHMNLFAPRGRKLAIDLWSTGDRAHISAAARRGLIAAYQESSAPLREQMFLQSLSGDQAGGNLLAISEAIRQVNPDVRAIWAVENATVQVPQGHSSVLIGSRAYFDALAESALLMFDHEVPEFLRARPGQRVVQTYHGHPFKMMGLSRFAALEYSPRKTERSLAWREHWDYLLAQNETAARLYTANYPLDFEVLVSGHPRNDELVTDHDELRARARAELGIRADKIVVLYAPTWRDYLAKSPWESDMVSFVSPGRLARDLGDNYIVLLRGHPAHGRGKYAASKAPGVIDVTHYPDINRLIAASDLGVFDYSSIRFDYAVTGKPMVFFVPDKDDFFAAAPGLLDFDETAPGPQVMNALELPAAIHARVSDVQSAEYATFVERFTPLDDGHAAERFAALLLQSLVADVGTQWSEGWAFTSSA